MLKKCKVLLMKKTETMRKVKDAAVCEGKV